jgi:hypothetical protein
VYGFKFFHKKQQRCEIFVVLATRIIYGGAAHRNIKLGYGALHLQATISTLLATNIAVRCTFEPCKNLSKKPKILRGPLKSGIWNLESGIWNLESGIWNLESGI